MSVSGQCFPACPLAYIFIWKLVFRGLIFLRFCNDSNEIRYDWLSEVVNFYFSEKIEKIVKRLIFFSSRFCQTFSSRVIWLSFTCVLVWKGWKETSFKRNAFKMFLANVAFRAKKKKKRKVYSTGEEIPK